MPVGQPAPAAVVDAMKETARQQQQRIEHRLDQDLEDIVGLLEGRDVRAGISTLGYVVTTLIRSLPKEMQIKERDSFIECLKNCFDYPEGLQ